MYPMNPIGPYVLVVYPNQPGASTSLNCFQQVPSFPQNYLTGVERPDFTPFVSKPDTASNSPNANHRCQFCTRAFSRRGNLVRHIRSHFGVKPFQCKECLKKFSTKSNLQSHVKTHERLDEYNCEFCGRLFKRSAFFERHIRAHETRKDSKKADFVKTARQAELEFQQTRVKAKAFLNIHSDNVTSSHDIENPQPRKPTPLIKNSTSSQLGRLKSPQLESPNSPHFESPKSPHFESPKSPRFESPKSPHFENPKSPHFERPKSPQLERPKSPQLERPKSPQLERPKSPQLERPKSPQLENLTSPCQSPQIATSQRKRMFSCVRISAQKRGSSERARLPSTETSFYANSNSSQELSELCEYGLLGSSLCSRESPAIFRFLESEGNNSDETAYGMDFECP